MTHFPHGQSMAMLDTHLKHENMLPTLLMLYAHACIHMLHVHTFPNHPLKASVPAFHPIPQFPRDQCTDNLTFLSEHGY